MTQLRPLSRLSKSGLPLEHFFDRSTNGLPHILSKTLIGNLRDETEFILLLTIGFLTIRNVANDRFGPIVAHGREEENFLLFSGKIRMRTEKLPHHPVTHPMMLKIIHIGPQQLLPLRMRHLRLLEKTGLVDKIGW